ncbi:MAG: YchF/TatD family DNA exonuclease [Anaerolineales bacterium]|nr:YchF/TatD family DNA exonuclease [Anaerolineales bacterium]
MNLTDTHCHLNFKTYRDDLQDVLSRAEANGIKRILVPALEVETSREVLSLADTHEMLYAAVGVHPNSAQTWNSSSAGELESLASHPKVVAIGEIGLDYYRDRAPKDVQIDILKKQLQIALNRKLPVILHVRNKTEEDRTCIRDLLDILEDWITEADPLPQEFKGRPGVIHSFSGNLEESKQALQLGFYLGITGSVTFKKADNIREVALHTPLSKLLIETDGPFITPHPFRGKRNEPGHVRYIVDKISEITGNPQKFVADQTTANAVCLFQWE